MAEVTILTENSQGNPYVSGILLTAKFIIMTSSNSHNSHTWRLLWTKQLRSKLMGGPCPE